MNDDRANKRPVIPYLSNINFDQGVCLFEKPSQHRQNDFIYNSYAIT